ncbi:MAG TPA: patatin-like phospholipase family protein [Spirochaetia bacterium]|nr:patatin-like phospholipase family protein [Spirochaetia bacterium]
MRNARLPRTSPRPTIAVLLACALCGAASAQEASAPAAAAPAGPAPAGAGYAFYGEDNPFLPVAEPMLLGEGRFVARARELAGGEEPFGLVLSGGSARAFAHIGVLEVLEEEGLRPDFIVADSMGAIVALLYGAGLAPADIAELFAAYPAAGLFDPELPTKGGFLDAGRFMGLVRALVGELDLAELPIPAMVACEDLLSRRQVLLAEGDFATVMAAAFALPAIFEPVGFRGMLLIDGGVTELVPVGVAYRYTGRVAAATALYGRELDYGSPFVVINRAIDIGKTRASIKGMLERRPVVVRCAVEDLSYMEFSRPAEVAARGRESARAALPELRALASRREADPELARRRAYFRGRVAALVAARRFDASFALPPDSLPQVELRILDEASGGAEAFQGRRWVGPSALFRGGPASLSLATLAGLEGEGERAWGAGLEAALRGYAFPKHRDSGAAYEAGLRALLSGEGILDAELSSPEARELAAAARASLAFSPARGLVLRPLASGELELGLPGGEAAWRASGGLGLELGSPGAFGLGLAAALDSAGNRGPDAWARVAWEPGGLLALRGRGLVHAALEGPGLEAADSDPYRSLALEGLEATRTICSAEVMWLARPLEASFGELFIVQRPELGAYCDFSSAGGRRRLSFGAAASLGLSVLGLAPLELSAFCGAATDGSGWVLGLRAGRYY